MDAAVLYLIETQVQPDMGAACRTRDLLQTGNLTPLVMQNLCHSL